MYVYFQDFTLYAVDTIIKVVWAERHRGEL